MRDYNIRTAAAAVLYDTSTRCTYSSLAPLVPGAAYLVYQDMLTSPVAAARVAIATGAWVESKYMILIHTWKCGSSSFIFTHPPEDEKRKKRKAYIRRLPGTWCSACKHPIDYTNQRYGRLSASA